MRVFNIRTPIKDISLNIAAHDDDKSVVPQLERGVYETHVQQLISNFARDKQNILDIGANYGQHTSFLSLINPRAHILAIEASDKNCEILNNTLKLNNCNNVTVKNVFLSNKKQKFSYYHETSNAACAFGCTTDYGKSNHPDAKQEIETETLDSICKFQPDFIKMDIEGAELDAISGGERVFKNCPDLLIELNKFTSEKFYNTKIEDVYSKLLEMGYNNMIIYTDKLININKESLDYYFSNNGIMIEVLFRKV